jgi:hypothetical protein
MIGSNFRAPSGWIAAALLSGCGPSPPRPACAPPAVAVTRLVPIDGITDAAQISLAGDQACVVRRGGQVVCWPTDWGEAAARTGRLQPKLEAVGGLGHVERISVESGHACAVVISGEIACWGSFPSLRDDADSGDELGNRAPRRVTDIADAVGVSTAPSHTCAARRTGQVVCWGDPDMGRLGSRTEGRGPLVVPGIEDAADVVVADLGGCAVTRAGRLWCWGAGYIGAWAPGRGDAADRDPRSEEDIVKPASLSDVADVVGFGSALGRCILRRSGHARCWDHKRKSMLDLGPPGSSHDVPGLEDGVRIRGTLVLRATGEIVAISPSSLVEPVAPEIHDAVDMAGGPDVGCAVRTTGAVACWSDAWRREAAAPQSSTSCASSATKR